MEFKNETERFVAEICNKAFLSLWSIPNPYTDEGITKNKTGKELCDLLVVFGNDVLIISVKHRGIHFTNEYEAQLAWGRWYRKAITKSVDQLYGAESWIRNYPDRVFYEKECKKRIGLLDTLKPGFRVHRLAISLGTLNAVQEFFGDVSGSLVINTSVIGDDHFNHPFNIGIVGRVNQFVHVFDDATFELVLTENDTISDLLAYLDKREKLLARERPILQCPGEEQLIGLYFQDINDEGDHDFIFPENLEDVDGITMMDDFFPGLINNYAYKHKKEADRISYAWDRLIEHFIVNKETGISDVHLEQGIRFLASENRLYRRELATALLDILSKELRPGQRYARLVYSKEDANRAYLLWLIAPTEGITRDEFREIQKMLLETATLGSKDVARHVRWIIGLGLCAQSLLGQSEMLCVLDTLGWGQADFGRAREARKQIKLFQEGAKTFPRRIVEYPGVEVMQSENDESQESKNQENVSVKDAIRKILYGDAG